MSSSERVDRRERARQLPNTHLSRRHPVRELFGERVRRLPRWRRVSEDPMRACETSNVISSERVFDLERSCDTVRGVLRFGVSGSSRISSEVLGRPTAGFEGAPPVSNVSAGRQLDPSGPCGRAARRRRSRRLATGGRSRVQNSRSGPRA